MTARGEVLWSPPPDVWHTTAAGRFATTHGFDDYTALHAWSIAELDDFWAATTSFTGVRWHDPPAAVREGHEMPGVRWFPGATLNYARHALAHADQLADRIAVIAHSQTRDVVELSWRDLHAHVARAAAGLRRLGVQHGDRVVAYAPNIPETLVAFLATASLGAVWSSCAPEFGVRSVIDRLTQIEPTVLVAIDGYRYGARAIDRRRQLIEVIAALPTLRHVVHIPYLDAEAEVVAGTVDVVRWHDLLGADDHESLQYEPVPFDHPLYALFSSGTTGLPKPIVHGHGGITVEHLKLLSLHHDLGVDDRFMWFSTTGWMMWNLLVSGLLVGSAVVLFDGDPGHPSLDALWEVATDSGCTWFGVSAPFLMACRKAGIRPERHALRWVGSTGAPLPAAGFRWVAETTGVPVASISGGTDVATAFVGASPLVPVRAGEISCRALGCAVEAFDPAGRSCPPSVTGELVVTEPMPSMPTGFWGDDDGSRYRAAYFEDFPGVWRHGDWVTFSEDGACTITGRSDATLNRGGVRLGTSDFYAVVESFPEVADSLVVHLEDTDDGDDGGAGLGELLLFVALVPGATLDNDADGLATRIRSALRSELSPRHVPDAIEVVPSVPHTLSGKKLEVPVKRILGGADPGAAASRESLADPDAITWYEERAHARRSTS